MLSGQYNISVNQGVSYSLSLNLKDNSGNYINLSGYSASGVIKSQYDSSGVLLNINPAIDDSYTSGLITINIPGASTASLPVMQGVYDLNVYDSSWTATRLLFGDFYVNPSATTSSPPIVIPSGLNASDGVTDLASQAFQELGEPDDFSIPIIAYWFRSNIGSLNSAINTQFYINPTTMEIERVDPSYGSNDQVIPIDLDEKYILKLMFVNHFYDVQIRKNIITYGTRIAVEVSSDNHKVRLASPTEIGKNLYMFKKGLVEELRSWINYYCQARSTPLSITGDDVVMGESSNSRPIYRRTYSYYNLR
jgi:hypothetical protein